MTLQIDRTSDVPVHEQIAAQLVFLIGTGRLQPGVPLPSVRALSMRLGIHRNTVGRAYHDPTLNLLVDKRAGRRLVVRASDVDDGQASNLDGLIGATIVEAQRRGYALRQIHECLHRHLQMAPPDRILVVAEDPGMRMLFRHELSERLRCRVDTCVPEELRASPQRCVGAVVVTPPGHVRRLRAAVPAHHPVVGITYADATEHLGAVRQLNEASLIAIVSVSEYFLEMAHAILAPSLGQRHSLHAYLLSGRRHPNRAAADLVFCDSLAYPVIRSRWRPRAISVYRAIAGSCMDTIASLIPRREGASSRVRP